MVIKLSSLFFTAQMCIFLHFNSLSHTFTRPFLDLTQAASITLDECLPVFWFLHLLSDVQKLRYKTKALAAKDNSNNGELQQ